MPVLNGRNEICYTAVGFETLSALSTATSLTAATDGTGYTPSACLAVVQCSGGTVRYRLDGTSPTASVGMLLADGAELNCNITDLSKAKFIAASGAPSLSIAYFE